MPPQRGNDLKNMTAQPSHEQLGVGNQILAQHAHILRLRIMGRAERPETVAVGLHPDEQPGQPRPAGAQSAAGQIRPRLPAQKSTGPADGLVHITQTFPPVRAEAVQQVVLFTAPDFQHVALQVVHAFGQGQGFLQLPQIIIGNRPQRPHAHQRKHDAQQHLVPYASAE